MLGALAGVGGAVVYEKVSDPEKTTTSKVDTSELDPLEVVSVNSVAKKVLPSVVKITAILPDGTGGTGSGSVISADGEIITNNHVVEIAGTGGATLTVSFSDGTNAEAELVGRDPNTDLALIKVTEASDLPVIEMGDSDKVEVGQAVVAVGSPYGLDATVTAGIISALHRPVVMPLGSDPNRASVYGAIQTDAPINPGNSGGALVNMAGRLVGVNSIIQLAGSNNPDSGGDLGNIGIGYAIPINDAMPIIEELRDGADAHSRAARGERHRRGVQPWRAWRCRSERRREWFGGRRRRHPARRRHHQRRRHPRRQHGCLAGRDLQLPARRER